MSNPDKCESDLIKLQAENERLKEALEGVVQHFDGMARDKDWIETERLVRLALKENSNELASASASPALGKDQVQSEASREVAPPVQAVIDALAGMLDVWSGYCTPEVDAAINAMQAIGVDRWSMQARMDESACFVCGGTGVIETYGGHGTVIELPCGNCCVSGRSPEGAETEGLGSRARDGEAGTPQASRHVVPPEWHDHLSRLRRFAMRVIKEGPWQGGDLDGGMLQEWAEELGLIECVPFGPEKHIYSSEQDYVDAGEPWYVFTPTITRRNGVSGSPPKGEDAQAAEGEAGQSGPEGATPQIRQREGRSE